jgi:hypothetical protein
MGSSAASSFARIFLSDEIECLTGLRKATRLKLCIFGCQRADIGGLKGARL